MTLLGLLAGLVLTVSGCASTAGPAGTGGSTSAAGIRGGDELPRPIVLTSSAQAARFRSSAGGTTTLGTLQQDKLMLLYFGYTHCPDVCPTTMADLGQALRELPSIIQAHTQVVFVTADPARDTPPVMMSWLRNFDASLLRPFVGLTASVTQIDAVAKTVGVPLDPPTKEPNGTISVEHGAETLAFINGKARVLWTAGTSVADYSHDIDTLITQVGGT